MTRSPSPAPPQDRTRRSASARVLVLSGPSGAGKSRLAYRLQDRFGWPVVRLDDFYYSVDHPDLPRSPLGPPDWDDPVTWDLDAALLWLGQLCRNGTTELPIYDISTSSVVGRHALHRGEAPLVLAEGIFAAQAIPRLRAEGLLAAAWCIRQGPSVTFARRLVRDLRQHRKSPSVLVRRGPALRRAEPGGIAEDVRLGAVPMNPREAERTARIFAGQ